MRDLVSENRALPKHGDIEHFLVVAWLDAIFAVTSAKFGRALDERWELPEVVDDEGDLVDQLALLLAEVGRKHRTQRWMRIEEPVVERGRKPVGHRHHFGEGGLNKEDLVNVDNDLLLAQVEAGTQI